MLSLLDSYSLAFRVLWTIFKPTSERKFPSVSFYIEPFVILKHSLRLSFTILELSLQVLPQFRQERREQNKQALRRHNQLNVGYSHLSPPLSANKASRNCCVPMAKARSKVAQCARGTPGPYAVPGISRQHAHRATQGL